MIQLFSRTIPICLFLLLLSSVLSRAQVSSLLNASFEGDPQDAVVPQNWLVCEPGTTPDILPGPWGVYNEAADGETYVGLITRENGSWESIGQRLMTPLKEKTCYTLTVKLAHSKTYAGYDQPIRLRIWGGRQICKTHLLIGETDFIEHTEWKTYTFKFTTKRRLHFIRLEAFYSDKKFSHKGNILIDDISVFKPCSGA